MEAEHDWATAPCTGSCGPTSAGYRLPATGCRLPALTRRRRDALDAAFGLSDAVPSDRHLVGPAALTLLSDAATAAPILCLVDGVQWLDRESAETLAFVGRRL